MAGGVLARDEHRTAARPRPAGGGSTSVGREWPLSHEALKSMKTFGVTMSISASEMYEGSGPYVFLDKERHSEYLGAVEILARNSAKTSGLQLSFVNASGLIKDGRSSSLTIVTKSSSRASWPIGRPIATRAGPIGRPQFPLTTFLYIQIHTGRACLPAGCSQLNTIYANFLINYEDKIHRMSTLSRKMRAQFSANVSLMAKALLV